MALTIPYIRAAQSEVQNITHECQVLYLLISLTITLILNSLIKHVVCECVKRNYMYRSICIIVTAMYLILRHIY